MEATEELYRRCEGIIDLCVGKVASAKPYLDRDELKSIANTVFMDATRDFDKSKGASFTTYLYNRLKCLNDEARNVLVPDGRGGLSKPDSIDDYSDNGGFEVKVNQSVIMPSTIEYTERMADDGYSELFAHCGKVLSADGADVVESVCADRLNTVGRKVKTVSQKDSRFSKNCVLNARKMWLRRYRNMGWTVDQCERTLQEVRLAVRQFSRGGLPCRLVRA